MNFMKKILLILVISVLVACNSDSVKKQPTDTTHQQHDSAELTLDNGSKWKADSITNHNIVNLKTMADNFRIKPFPNVNEYHLLGNDLSNGLNTMIQQCKMTGPGHEVLHHWLEPILNETKELKNVNDTASGRAIFQTLDKHIDTYHTYFE
jgi:hypothetical protein